MTRLFMGVLAMSLALTGCADAADRERGLINDVIAHAWQQRDSERAKTRTALAFADGSSVDNCNEYLTRIAQAGIAETLESQQIKSEYLICEALDLLGRSRPSGSTEGAVYGAKLADSLDLRSFPSSLNMRSDETVHTLSALVADDLAIDSASVTMDDPEWHYRLEVVAVRDINGNDTQDWIVWLADEAKQGSYRGYVTLVVVDPEDEGAFAATPYAPAK